MTRSLSNTFLGLALLACGTAQAAAPEALQPTNLPGTYLYPAPPAGFDPLHASDDALRAYGFPPRPHALHSRAAYRVWARLVSAAKIRIEPVLEIANTRSTEMRAAPNAVPSANNGVSTSWSGDVLIGSATGFGQSSFYTLWGEYNVPIAQQPFGTCGSTSVRSNTWIGLDGYNSNDIVQSGTESDATCANGNTSGTYYAWYAWYPQNQTIIKNFPVAPGNDIGVQLVVSNTTTASVFMTNETTNQYFSVQFSAPAGTQFIGNSAEWVLGRPQVGGNLAPLTNYVTQWTSNMISLLENGTLVFGGIGAPGVSSSLITMVDSNNNNLSVPTNLGGGGIVMHVAGSAK